MTLKANSSVESVIAEILAGKIKEEIGNSKLSSSIRVGLGTHIILEAIIDTMGLDKKEFKNACGIGQPLAYFI